MGSIQSGDRVYPAPRSLLSSEGMEIHVYMCDWVNESIEGQCAAELIREHCTDQEEAQSTRLLLDSSLYIINRSAL